jgi:uncharacterized membrane protein YkvA (DUF1232 family)
MLTRLFKKIKQKADTLKIDIMALWFSYRDRRTPWYAKLWAVGVVGYAFSPIDLIPDFIPFLGYLDDAILLPIGVFIAIRLIPRDVLDDSRQKARVWFEQSKGKPKNWVAGGLILILWILILLAMFFFALKLIRH